MYPRLFTLGNITLPTYGACMALAVIASLLLATALARRTSLDPDRLWTFGLLGVFSAIVCSKLLAVAANWSSFLATPRMLLSLPALARPGLDAASIALAFFACLVYLLYARLPMLRVLDVAAPALALGQSIASIGSLMAGSSFGRPITGSGSHWGILFNSRFAERTTGVPLGIPLYPVQIYESAATLFLCAILLWLLSRPHKDGEIIGASLFLYGFARFYLDFYRGDAGRGSVFGGLFSAVQLLAMLMVVLGGVLWGVTLKPSTRLQSDAA